MTTEMSSNLLSSMEMDVIGEVMNISMGSGATALSTVLDTKVNITTPRIQVVSINEFEFAHVEPAVGVSIKYVEGIDGVNVLLLKEVDLKKILCHLLSMDSVDDVQFDEIAASAICEIMNQMMGSSASALAQFLGKPINISPPELLDSTSHEDVRALFEVKGDEIVSIKFDLNIEGLVESEFISAMDPALVKEIVSMTMGGADVSEEIPTDLQPDAGAGAQAPAQAQPQAPPQGQPQAQPMPDMSQQMPPAQNAGPQVIQPISPQPDMQAQMMQGQQAMGMGMQQPMYQQPMGMGMQQPMYQQQPQMGMPPMYPQQPMYQQPQAPIPAQQVNASPYSYKQLGEAIGLDLTDSNNLELVMSVPIKITVELGTTKKKIKDIVDLCQGNIVELDRQAGDQVDILANGRLIAKGDVVVVDDNYSVRVTEIVKRENETIL